MIKYLKKLLKRYFRGLGYSGTKPVISIEPADGLNEEIISKPIPEPKPLHCANHNRFKKSCPTCAEVIK